MKNADYMVEQMIKHQDKWDYFIDENGETVIINHCNKACRGVKEEDGTIITAEKLVNMYNQTLKIES